MLMPSIFGENFIDRFFEDPFEFVPYEGTELMKTDIKDMGSGYEVTMNLPGVMKEDVKAELKDGYLTVSASSNSHKEEKDETGRYIRRERYSGSLSRSFYVGENITQEDIKAKFENGTLIMSIPKKEEKPAVEEKKYISIEG